MQLPLGVGKVRVPRYNDGKERRVMSFISLSSNVTMHVFSSLPIKHLSVTQ